MIAFDRRKLEDELIVDEGVRLKVYRCTEGKLTIGVGRNLDANGIHPGETAVLGITRESCIANGISRIQAMVLLDNDIDRCVADLDRGVPWWRQLADARQRVLLNMCFNMGLPTLLAFKNTLRLIKQGEYVLAGHAMLQSKWARQVKARAVRLADMMEKGR